MPCGMFSIADTIYHFHDSVFIKVPHTYLEKYYTLLDKYGNEILEEYGLDELPIAFAHLVVNDPDVNKGIYLETGTIKGVSKQEVVNELKDQYGLKVYDNNSKKEI